MLPKPSLLASLLISLSLSLPLSRANAASPAAAATPSSAASSVCNTPEQKIHEQGFVTLGGIEQWVTVQGERCANPVILLLHGGPGNPLSPYADTIYGSWAKSFTLVQWDQRGAGKTWGRNPAPANSALTLQQMADDGIQLANYLKLRFGKQKIIVMGGSWGSILGVQMVKQQPDLFYAWVGVSQYVSYRDNGPASYSKVLGLARQSDDQKTVAALEAMGPPPWSNPRNFGVLRRAIRSYEAKTTTPPPKDYWQAAAAYATPQSLAAYEEGEDYSFLQFIGPKGDGMVSKVDFFAMGPEFKLPVFMIHGSEDLLTTPEIAKRYFDSIKAPAKEFVLVPRAGHDPNGAMVEAQYKIMMEKVRPLAQ
ncbi:MAG: hypothetical protein RL748_2956 [Pseudomonadota bacterium]|jgi:pimeloyl-ACP methyl ester carboxylesterase